MKVLVTGVAGFIGMHCAERLAARGDEVIGIDVQVTYADSERLARATGFAPSTPLEAGLAKFFAWFKSYYGYA